MMLGEMARRIEAVQKGSSEKQRGVTLFYRFLFAFLLTGKDGSANLAALDRLANSRQEIEESLSTLSAYPKLSQEFGEELDFFLRWVEDVRENYS